MYIDREKPVEANRSQRGTSRPVRKSRSNPGRFLKDPPPSSQISRKRKPKGISKTTVLVVVLAAVLIGAILGVSVALLLKHFTPPSILGRWDVDGVTMYEFGENGKGTLILSVREYEFDYKFDGETLTINFPEGIGTNATYTVTLKNNLMYWIGGTGDANNRYLLTRVP